MAMMMRSLLSRGVYAIRMETAQDRTMMIRRKNRAVDFNGRILMDAFLCQLSSYPVSVLILAAAFA